MAVSSQVTNGPLALQQTTGHGAQLVRMALTTFLGGMAGVVGSGDFLVTAQASPNMTVNVATGKAWVVGTSTAAQSDYFVYNDATVILTIGAHSSQSRIDSIALQVEDAAYAGASNLAQLVVVAGTPSGSPVPPTLPASCFLIANIAVSSSATTITTGDITDERTFAFATYRLFATQTAVSVATNTTIAPAGSGMSTFNVIGTWTNESPGFQVPAAGLYLVTAGVNCGSAFAGYTGLQINILQNGGNAPGENPSFAGTGTALFSANASAQVLAAATDSIGVSIYQDSGSTQDLNVGLQITQISRA